MTSTTDGFTPRNCIIMSALGLLVLGAVVFIFSTGPFRYRNINNDIQSYIFGAETFALGRTWVTPPEPHKLFDQWMVVTEEQPDGSVRMYTRYPPGYPAALLIFSRIVRNYRLVPVLTAVLGAFFIVLICRQLFGEKAGVIAAWVPVFSPYYLWTGSSLLSHGTTLLFLAAGTLCFVRMDKNNSWGWGLLAGLCFGEAFLCRQLTGLAFIGALIVYELATVKGRTGGELAQRWIPPFIGGGAMLALLFLYNASVTGSPLDFAFLHYWSRDQLGFGNDFGWTNAYTRVHVDHTLLKGIENILHNFASVDQRLLLFLPAGATVTVFFTVLLRKRIGRFWLLFFSQVALLAFGYMFFYSQGMQNGGPVYFYEMNLPFFCLLPPMLLMAFAKLREQPLRIRVGIVAACFFVGTSGTLLVMSRTWKLQMRQEGLRHYFSEAVKVIKKPAIVFLPPRFYYVGQPLGHMGNPPSFDSMVLVTKRPANSEWHQMIAQLQESFPEREIYELLTGDRKTVVRKVDLKADPPDIDYRIDNLKWAFELQR